MTEIQNGLAEFVRTGSDLAFRKLVTDYVDLVYSTALRLVGGDAHRAEDVTQTVFTNLARVARTLPKDVKLGGWLHRDTCFTAATLMRGERRRQTRERQAVEMNALQPDSRQDFSLIAPLLDEAINELGDADRTAILLRFFEEQDFQSVGQALGSNEDAARMRVNRALEKLQDSLERRGFTSSAAALSVVLSAHAVQAAPVGLALTISTAAALTGTTLATTIATQTTMNWINLKSITAILTAALAAGSGTYLTQKQHATTLERENQTLRTEKIALSNERDSALANVGFGKVELARLLENQNDLLRLRAEVAALRKQSTELNQLREDKRQLQAALQDAAKSGTKTATEPENDPERQVVYAKLNDAKLLVLGMLMFANDNQDQFPADLSQATNYWKNAEHQFTDTNNFELVLRGPLKSVTNPSTVIAVREKNATFLRSKWFKVYGFADGHAELKAEPPEGFAEWEKAHIIPSPPTQ